MSAGALVLRVYVGRANAETLLFYTQADGQDRRPQPLGGVVRMVLVILAPTPVTIDSDDHSAAFDWTTGNDPDDTGAVTFALGEVPGLPPAGSYPCRLTAIDSDGDAEELVHERMGAADVRVQIVETSSLP